MSYNTLCMAGRRPANHKENTQLSHSINQAQKEDSHGGHNVTCKSQIKLNCPKLPGVKNNLTSIPPSPQLPLCCAGWKCMKGELIGVRVLTMSRLRSGQFVCSLPVFCFVHVFHATEPCRVARPAYNSPTTRSMFDTPAKFVCSKLYKETGKFCVFFKLLSTSCPECEINFFTCIRAGLCLL